MTMFLRTDTVARNLKGRTKSFTLAFMYAIRFTTYAATKRARYGVYARTEQLSFALLPRPETGVLGKLSV